MINLERISCRMNVNQVGKNLLPVYFRQGYRQIGLPSYNRLQKVFYSNSYANISQNNINQGRALMSWKWSKRIGLGLIGIFGVLTLSGLLYQSISTKLDENKYPPIGKMVDVGGYHLHINCSGNGGPTVVLDAGMGCNSLEWALVQSEIAKFAKVCSYDRAGYGWSDESSLERTSLNIAVELHTLLHNAEIPGPYILVGHSLGGANIRLYASKYPDEVIGIILVDSAHEDQLNKFPMPQVNTNVALFFSYTGLNRILSYLPENQEALKMFPTDIQEMSLTQSRHTKFMKTLFGEMVNIKKSFAQLRDAGNLHDKPLIVITAAKRIHYDGTEYTEEQIEELWKDSRIQQKDLVSKSTKGKQVIAEQSDHMITRHQPNIIVESVREIVNEIVKK